MDLNDFNKVLEIKTLRKFRESEAREILQNIAKQVQPIMCKHKWKIRILSEFWYWLLHYSLHFFIFSHWLVSMLISNLICSPGNPSLLGLNIGGGSEVKIRLRRPNNELDFFPYIQILDTMLHELCHNEYGPHNTQFYNLLDEIRKVIGYLMFIPKRFHIIVSGFIPSSHRKKAKQQITSLFCSLSENWAFWALDSYFTWNLYVHLGIYCYPFHCDCVEAIGLDIYSHVVLSCYY